MRKNFQLTIDIDKEFNSSFLDQRDMKCEKVKLLHERFLEDNRERK